MVNTKTKSINRKFRFILFFSTLFVLSACLSSHLISLVDQNRLVPVSLADIISAIPLVIILYISGVFLTLHFRIEQSVRWFSVFFIIRLVISMILSILFMYDDERGFHYAGILQPYGLISFEGGRAYYHLIAFLYSVFGANILLPKAVNAFVGSLLPFLVFSITTTIFHDRGSAWRAFLLCGLLPPFVVYSAVVLKEIVAAMLLIMVVHSLVISQRKLFMGVLYLAISISLLYWVRGAPLTLVGLSGVIVYYAWGVILRRQWRSRFVVPVVILFLLSIWVVPNLINTIQEVVWIRVNKGTYFIDRFTRSKATVMRFLNVKELMSLKNLGILLLRGLYSPSPLRWILDPGIDTLIEGLIMFVWYILFPLAIIGMLRFKQHPEVVAIAIMGLAVLAMASMGIAVGSDPFRHRIMGMGLFVILASVAFDREGRRGYHWVIWIWILGAIGFTGLWLIFRLR